MDLLAQTTQIEQTIEQISLFDPNFLNLQYFFNLVLLFFKNAAAFIAGGSFDVGIINKTIFKNIFIILNGTLLLGTVYVILKLRSLYRKEEEKWGALHLRALEGVKKMEHNRAWEEVLTLLDSFNESDWRVAIIKADTMLEELLETLGYHGESVGDRLKGIEESDFLTLDKAWGAHKVRNKIAHEGEFALSKREARRVIDLYRDVFEEFQFI